MGQYFLAQRIKPDAANYVDQLKAAHGVIVAAMKCKQAADPATAESLKRSMLVLYRAYTGKEPQFGAVDAKSATRLISTTVRSKDADHAEHGHHDEHDGHDHGDHDHAHDAKK